MPNFLEFEAKNVDKALEAAASELDCGIDALDYDVVSYGSSGIFGLVGVKKAKIRVKTDNGHVSGRLQQDARSQARDLVSDAFGDEKKPAAKPAPKAPRPPKQPKPAHTAKPKPEKQEKQEKAEKPDKEERVEKVELPPEDVEKAIADGTEALKRLLDFITEGTTIKAEAQNGRLLFNVEGGNSALLIGKRGQTLEAIQYLVEKIINKKNDSRMRVLVDVEGYLSTRKSNLQRMAGKMAEKAKRINKPVTIGQMNAHDRRIVHMHLKENQAVRTQSVGEGYYRKLIIFPKKRRRSRGPKKPQQQ